MRLSLAAVLAFSAIAVSGSPSMAAPKVTTSKQQLDAARAKLAEMDQKFSQLVEDYNFARYQLTITQQKLGTAQAAVDEADSAAQAAHEALAQRAVVAYEGGVGSVLDVLLGSADFNEFADRITYLDQLAANDADLASQAQVTGEQAHRAALDLQALKADQQKKSDELSAAKEELTDNIAQQESMIAKYQAQYQDALAAQRAARSGGSTTPIGTGGSDGGVAPPTSSGAAGAVEAALSMVGKPYVWGGASPDVGFDCSGLTLWAWGQVGVSLPHSAAAQYASVPHVSREDLQPGDLLFFYSPISHVGMYIGGNQMVNAQNSSVPVQVVGLDYWWKDFIGAGRPG